MDEPAEQDGRLRKPDIWRRPPRMETMSGLSTGNPRVGKLSKLQRVLEPTCQADSVHVVHHLPSIEEARIEYTFKDKPRAVGGLHPVGRDEYALGRLTTWVTLPFRCRRSRTDRDKLPS